MMLSQVEIELEKSRRRRDFGWVTVVILRPSGCIDLAVQLWRPDGFKPPAQDSVKQRWEGKGRAPFTLQLHVHADRHPVPNWLVRTHVKRSRVPVTTLSFCLKPILCAKQ